MYAAGNGQAVGAPLNIALDGSDADGQALTYSVTTDNPDLLWEIPTGNSSLKITVSYTDKNGVAKTGDMIFQLFDDLTPNTTARIKELVNSGFYNGVIFHRIIDNFMIQGGDPTGTGTGGSPLGQFDDEYHPDLQFTSSGILAMAKSSDDTNNSQFFITDVPTRHLDFNHTIFGFLTEGNSVRDDVNSVPTGANNKPVNNVTMTSVTLLQDTQNAVLRLKAKPGATGSANVTVTATDPDGNHYSQTFQVSIQTDTNNNNPYLLPLPETITITQGGQVNLTLAAYDAENSIVEFQVNAVGTGLEFDVPSDTIQAQPVNGIGTLDIIIKSGTATPGAKQIRFYVRPAGSGTTEESVIDAQYVTVLILPKPPTGVVLDPAFDTGSANNDGFTNLDTALKFRVAGVEVGATVQLKLGEQVVGEATATAQNLNNGVLDITTTPGFVFGPGEHSLTATQKVNGVVSVNSPSFLLTVDKQGPVYVSTPPVAPILAGVEKANLYNVETNEEATTGVTYQLVTKPSGMTINAATGVIAWHPQLNQSGSHQVVVRATDKAGNFSDQTFQINVQANTAPTLEAVEDQSIDEGQDLHLQIVGDDANIALGDVLTYSLVGDVPQGAAIHPVTGFFSWTPGEIHGGNTYTIKVRATDLAGNQDEVTFHVTVNDVEEPPVLGAIANQVVKAGETLSLQITATDPDVPAQQLTFSLDAAPQGMTINPNTGLLTWQTNPNAQFEQVQVTVRVTDTTDRFDTKTFAVSVVSAPVIANIAHQTVAEGSTLSVVVQASSAVTPTPTFTYSLVTAPTGAVINPQSGVIGFTPTEAQGPGEYSFTVKVTDSNGLSATESFLVTVTEVNQAPVLAPLPDQKIARGANFQLQATATDADLPTNALTFSLQSGAPEGMTIDPQSGLITWAVPADQAVGALAITVKVTDDGNLSHTRSFTLAVIAPPIIDEIDNRVVAENSTLAFTVAAHSEVAPTPSFTYSLIGPPAGATIHATSGAFNWTPSEAQGPGEYTIVVKVVDSNGLSATSSFNVIVEEVNAPPVLAPLASQVANAGSLFQVKVTASDPDLPANALKFSLVSGAPQGMTIDENSGSIKWSIPANQPAGDIAVQVQVRDEGGLTDTKTLVVTVQSKPIITPLDDVSVDELQTLVLQIHASSSVVPTPTLHYALGTAPQGATIDPATGLFTWTPSEDQGGARYPVTVVVTDSNGLSETATFQIDVAEANQAPLIAPIPNLVAAVGRDVTVQVSATDADRPANTLTYSLVSGPEGATIDPVTGLFRWTPAANQATTAVSVVVRVTDSGQPALFSEASFAITFGDPAVALIPGGGPGLPSFISPSSASANLITAVRNTIVSDTFVGAGDIALVGSTGAAVVLGGYQGDTSADDSRASQMVRTVTDFQIGPDTGVGSQVRPTPQKQRVRRPATKNEEEPAEQDNNSAKGQMPHRQNVARPISAEQQSRADQHPEVDAAIASLDLQPGDIVIYQLMSRQKRDGLQVYSQPQQAGERAIPGPAAMTSPGEHALPPVGIKGDVGSHDSAASPPAPNSGPAAPAAAAATAMFLPMLVTDLTDDEPPPPQRRPRRKAR